MFVAPSCPPGGTELRFGNSGDYDAFLFSDGTVKRGVAGGGYSLLNTRGVEVRADVIRLAERTLDSTKAELMALLAALQACAQTGVRRLWVGTDSYQLLEHAAKSSSRYADCWHRLAALLGQFEAVTLQAIERRRNKRADALARQSIAHIR